MTAFFANRSCDPFTRREGQCVLGSYTNYAVYVKGPEDVVKALAFVKEHNVRLVVRNTGHDFMGKSGGSSSLSIWTHHLKNIEIIERYRSKHYNGPAMRIGAGVQVFEAYAVAHDYMYRVVGARCPTVGLAGGYTQGGGHSALGSKHGLGADQVLEIDFVDAQGRSGTATRSNRYSDLFWAMSGGGGGTYAILLSMVVRLIP